QVDVLDVADRVIVVEPHARGRRPAERVPRVRERAAGWNAIAALVAGDADHGPERGLAADGLCWIRRRERVCTVVRIGEHELPAGLRARLTRLGTRRQVPARFLMRFVMALSRLVS